MAQEVLKTISNYCNLRGSTYINNYNIFGRERSKL